MRRPLRKLDLLDGELQAALTACEEALARDDMTGGESLLRDVVLRTRPHGLTGTSAKLLSLFGDSAKDASKDLRGARILLAIHALRQGAAKRIKDREAR